MMKRICVFLLLGVLLFSIALSGCSHKEETEASDFTLGESQDKVNVNFIIEGTSTLVQIDQGSVITKDVLPAEDQEKTALFYYDENCEVAYNDEMIRTDVTIYVKYYSFEELIQKASDDFYEQYNGKLAVNRCYGEFNGALVFFIAGDAFDVSDPKTVNEVVSRQTIDGFIFSCPYEFSILMWKNGQFYALPNYDVEANEWLTMENVE